MPAFHDKIKDQSYFPGKITAFLVYTKLYYFISDLTHYPGG